MQQWSSLFPVMLGRANSLFGVMGEDVDAFTEWRTGHLVVHPWGGLLDSAKELAYCSHRRTSVQMSGIWCVRLALGGQVLRVEESWMSRILNQISTNCFGVGYPALREKTQAIMVCSPSVMKVHCQSQVSHERPSDGF